MLTSSIQQPVYAVNLATEPFTIESYGTTTTVHYYVCCITDHQSHKDITHKNVVLIDHMNCLF